MVLMSLLMIQCLTELISRCSEDEINAAADDIPAVLSYMNTVIINSLANRGNNNNGDRQLPNCGVCHEGAHLFEECPQLRDLKKVSRGFGRLFVAVRKFINAVKAIDDIPTMQVSNIQHYSEEQ